MDRESVLSLYRKDQSKEVAKRMGFKEQHELFIKGLRYCRICKNIKSLSEFGKDSSQKDGCRTECKKCHNEENKKYQKASKHWKSYFSKYMTKYYQKRCIKYPDTIPQGKVKEWRKRSKPFSMRPKGWNWTGREVEILTSLYPKGGVPAVIKRLPNRTKWAVAHKAHSLGVKRDVR